MRQERSAPLPPRAPAAGFRLALFACLLVQGCGLSGGQDVGQRTARGGGETPALTVDELDQITKSFADRYVVLLANACDDLKRIVPSPEQRLTAHRLKLSGAAAAFDAATGPDPVRQLVDLAVGVMLQKIVWVDEKQAEETFGPGPSDPLSRALETADAEVRGLCGRAMSAEQLDVLQKTIRTWRHANPRIRWVADIRFDVIAGAEGASLVEGIAGTLSPESGSVTDSIGQARLLGQRAFYYLKRLPRLLDWQAEEALQNALSTPRADEALQGTSAALKSAAGLLARLEDLLAAPESEAGGAALGEIRQILREGKELARAAGGAAEAFAGLRAPPGEPSAPPGRPFDVREYGAAASQFATTLREASDLLREAKGLTESEFATRRLDSLLDGAARRASRERLRATDRMAWRAAQLILLVFLLTTAYTGLLLFARRRSRRAPVGTPGP